MWWDSLSQNVQCHLQAFGHRKRGDETIFHKMWNVTHSLLVIGKDVIRLCFTKCAMPLAACWTDEKMWWDCLSQNSMSFTRCRSQENMWWDHCSKNVQCHSLAIGHIKDVMSYLSQMCKLTCCGRRKRCDETIFHQVCNVTHFLLVIGKDVMRLSFTKCAMSLTRCWS